MQHAFLPVGNSYTEHMYTKQKTVSLVICSGFLRLHTAKIFFMNCFWNKYTSKTTKQCRRLENGIFCLLYHDRIFFIFLIIIYHFYKNALQRRARSCFKCSISKTLLINAFGLAMLRNYSKLQYFHFFELHSNGNPIYVFLGVSLNFHIRVSVSELYIPRIGPHIFLQQKRQIDRGNI